MSLSYLRLARITACHISSRRHHLPTIRAGQGRPRSAFLASLKKEKRKTAGSRGTGREERSQTLPISRDICPPAMCQTCVLTRGQAAPSTSQTIYSDVSAVSVSPSLSRASVFHLIGFRRTPTVPRRRFVAYFFKTIVYRVSRCRRVFLDLRIHGFHVNALRSYLDISF